MANTLTNLIPTLYQSIDTVSRELVGMIPSVSINASADGVALDEVVRVPIVPTETASDITPGVTAPDNGDAVIGNTNMTVDKSRMVPIRFNGDEMLGLRNGGTLNPIVANRFTQAFRTLTNEVESDLAALHIYASRAYGTAGTTPFGSNLGETAQMLKILQDNGAPTNMLSLVMDTTAGANLRSLTQLTDVNRSGTDAALRMGELLNVNKFSLKESAGIVTSVAGTAASSTTDATGYAVGSTTITLASVGTGTIVAGDVITFAGDTNKYVVLSGDADVSGGGTITLAAPGLRAAIPAATTAITVVAAAARNMAFDKGAIQLLARTPMMPDGGDSADDVTIVTDPISGLSFQVAVYRQYKQVKYEVGLAWGVKAIKPEHIGILLG